MADRLRIGIVGAGPVTERYHLAAVRGVPEVRPTLIVDGNDGMAAVDVVCRAYGSVGAPSWQSVAVS